MHDFSVDNIIDTSDITNIHNYLMKDKCKLKYLDLSKNIYWII